MPNSANSVLVLPDEFEALQRDAERYRFLRNPVREHCITVEQFGNVRSTLHSEALDEAVDREMRRTDGGGAHG
jgi:hypothetical protein